MLQYTVQLVRYRVKTAELPQPLLPELVLLEALRFMRSR